MSMRWLKLTVAYDGTDYAGWQIQPAEPTVQAAVEAAWRELTQESARITAASRTDAGVHALGQVVGVATESQLTKTDLLRGLNALLPADVSVLGVEDAPEDFHATHNAVGKLYRYHIHNGRVPDVFARRFAWHYPQALDAAAMHAAGQTLVGTHDFASFASAGSERPDSVRTITRLSVQRGRLANDEEQTRCVLPYGTAPADEQVILEVAGDGFLYNMVRAITGTLIEVGKGARDAEWVAQVLAARDRSRAGQTAPPHGLFLVRVDYDL